MSTERKRDRRIRLFLIVSTVLWWGLVGFYLGDILQWAPAMTDLASSVTAVAMIAFPFVGLSVAISGGIPKDERFDVMRRDAFYVGGSAAIATQVFLVVLDLAVTHIPWTMTFGAVLTIAVGTTAGYARYVHLDR